MQETNLPNKITKVLEDFVNKVSAVYGEGLISAILYGSAASGEFNQAHSNINVGLDG